ncbi:MAG: hypothetical protein AB4426_14040 [Xenococcaceae cyanobacterium]
MALLRLKELEIDGLTPMEHFQSKLEQVTQERDRLKARLEQVTQERDRLKARLASRDDKHLQEIQSQLGTLDELLRKTIERVEELEKRDKEFEPLQFDDAVVKKLEQTLFNSLYSRLYQELGTHGKLNQSRTSYRQLDDAVVKELEQTLFNRLYSRLYQESGTYQREIPPTHQATQAPKNQSTFITPYDELVATYNRKPDSLSKDATKVSVTKESIEKSSQPVVFEPSNRGNYWIVIVGDFHYLFPKPNIKLNEFNYQYFQNLFKCYRYQPEYSSQFKLLIPARVSPTYEGKKWKLVDQGVLQFESREYADYLQKSSEPPPPPPPQVDY